MAASSDAFSTGRSDTVWLATHAEWALVQAAVFFAPFNSFRHPAVFITLSDCLFVMSFFFRLLVGVPLRPLGAATWLWILGLAMLTGGMLTSSVIYGDPLRGMIVTLQYDFAFFILPLAVMCRPHDQAIRLIKCGVLGMVVICVSGFFFYHAGYTSDYETKQYVFVTGGGRMASFVDNPNGAAGLIALAMPLLIFLAFARETWIVTAIVFFAILFVGLILTSSNTGLFMACLGIGIFMLGRLNMKTIATLGVFCASVAYVVTKWGDQILPETFQKRVMGALTSGDVTEAGTFQSRYALMREAWGMVDQHMLLGLGADQYRLISAHDLPVHNTYLLLWCEGGFLALIGWLVILCSALIAGLDQIRRPKGGLTFMAIVTLATVTAAFAMAAANMYARFLILPLLLAVGPAVSIATKAQPERMRPASEPDKRADEGEFAGRR